MKREMKLSHPGEILKMEILEGRSLTISKAAKLLDISGSTLTNIVNGKTGITPSLAFKIEKVFGGYAKLWIRLQATYDLAK
ncbi:HigA family addiction module antitoxin [Belliella sp. DSM 111904]|uniref:HigA family addiction module antitoxin n=1 Tax=Belliella filtrata TaxID=2923435 RepID=A0ABS9V0I6_9BACT|nr:HigA family addiction module antitoxin [Belliella filtrata]MCH7409923.1 HigA family addiction module antitoxin [Belliella filtrata]